jgi:hypothetical protein
LLQTVGCVPGDDDHGRLGGDAVLFLPQQLLRIAVEGPEVRREQLCRREGKLQKFYFKNCIKIVLFRKLMQQSCII